LVYPTVEENGQTRLKKYSEFTEEQKLQDDCDVQATSIILHGLPPDVYVLVNHHEVAKANWDKVKLLMKGTELLYQERECQLYDLFDKFAFVQGETLYEYYWRFSQLINDMHTVGMTMQQVQVNTNKELDTTTYDQLYAYLNQHERHANVERIMRERYPYPIALIANSQTLYNPSQSPQHSVPTMHPPPQQFTPVYAAPIHHQQHHNSVNPQQYSVSPQPYLSPFPPSNNQLRTSSNLRNQATIQDGRVTIQQIQGRQTQSFAGTGNRGNATNLRGTNAAGQPRVVKCYNRQREGHMERHFTQPKKPRNTAWFKEKLMLAEAQEAGQILDEEQLAFLADLGMDEASVAQQIIPQNAAF
ncbi:hypothetical protein Tco_0780974, partial [Tanacetum coccineum]